MNKKVALFANAWNGENLDLFIEGFNEYFTNDDVDLFVFSSYMLSGQSQALQDAEDSIYDLPDYSFFDAVVIYGAGINSDDMISRFVEKCKAVNVPVVLQGCDVDDISSVTIDNYVGMKNLCDHLIEKHGVSEVVYIAGDVDNGDSNFRLKVLQDSLKEHGLELKEENIFYACWSARLIQAYLLETYGNGQKKMPDAIMCANDQMAISTLSFLDEMGVNVPEEVLVTGFDNLSPGQAFSPSLATVDQNYRKQGLECAKIVAEIVNDKKLVKKSVIPTVLSPGESCGCVNCKGEAELRKKVARDNWANLYAVEILQGRKLHLDFCIMSNEKFEDINKNMKEDFFKTTGQETEDFHIYVNPQYKELKYMNIPEDKIISPYYNPVMEVIAARTGGVICEDSTINPKKLLLGYDGNGKGKTFVFVPLRVDHSVFGYMVMGYTAKAFDKKKYLEFSGCLRTTFTQYQRNIEDYNHAIKIKKDADMFLHQTVEALASAVDAKDSYTHGHSARVAKYARKIAKLSGMSEEACDDVYLAGLLHDVGKIGISDVIINKTGKLSSEEFSVIKQHPALGDAILEKIHMLPSLSTGARHHHERYDGNGYPDNLKGTDIPQIARIIAVADAYDAMTSKRSYRDIIPQMQVREELVKGYGTQFDPAYAKIMVRLLDMDVEYQMKENSSENVFGANTSRQFGAYKSLVSDGLHITDCLVTIHMQYESLSGGGVPTLLLYDSADAIFHLEGSPLARDMDFVEFGQICLDGKVTKEYARKVQQNTTSKEPEYNKLEKKHPVEIQIVKKDDHVLVKILTQEKTEEVIYALQDASRFVYLALTGEYCSLDILDIDVADTPVEDDYIPRIAEKVSYIDCPAGDIPNIQVDGWRTKASEVLGVADGIDVTFRTMSLPSSERIWHCPIICMFTSDDGKIGGKNYKEVALVRLDGESWSEHSEISNNAEVRRGATFENWSVWLNKNKEGVYCTFSVQHEENKINFKAENGGLEIVNQTVLPEKVEKVFCYLTGDQCAITDIHVKTNS